MAKQAARSAARAKTYTVKEMTEFLVDNVPELREAFTRADIELALDDRGWLVPGRQWTSADLDAQTRTTLVAKSRLYWLRDPLAKQAVRLWTDYALGNGITYQCGDDADQTALDSFSFSRRNRVMMNSEGQRRSSKKLLVDGEVFFAVFTEKDGTKSIRYIDPLQITDIVCDPDDDEHILGYRRLTAQDKTLWYLDWTTTPEDESLFLQQKTNSEMVGKPVDDCVVYHVKFDTLLKRGNGLLFSVCDWSKEHRRMMEARVAIISALAKYAWKGQVKGGQGVINDIQTKLASTYATAGMTQVERHPQPAPGGTWLQNSGMDLTPMPRTTGAGDAMQDSNAMKLMVATGTGVMLHYFGDPSTGNLATATAMELPMLKMFESYQQLWKDAYRDLFSIVLDEDVDDEKRDIEIDMPPILADDLTALGTAVTNVTTVFPELKGDAIMRMCLVSMGVTDVDAVMVEAKKQRAIIDQQAADDLKAQQAHEVALAGKGQNPNVNQAPKGSKKGLAQASNGIPTNPESGYETTEAALEKIVGILTKLSEALS